MSTLFEMRRPGLEGPIVADGCVFPDGRTVLAWRGEHASVAIYPTPEACYAVHRHGDGDTWLLHSPGSRGARWEMSLDPLHEEAFAGTPAEGVAGRGGERHTVWLAIDAWGNAVGVGPAVIEHAAQ